MRCQLDKGQIEDSEECPCSVCKKRVGSNSSMCVEYHSWVHIRCGSISGKLKSNGDFHRTRCFYDNSDPFVERNVILECVILCIQLLLSK